MPLTRQSIRFLLISYLSAMGIILLLLTAKQVLIQYTLIAEQRERAVASAINDQELRTERMQRNVILLQSPDPSLDYLAITREIEADEIVWDRTQEAIYSGNDTQEIAPSDFSVKAKDIMTKIKPTYTNMLLALHRIFNAENDTAKGADPAKVRPDVGIFFVGEQPYLDSLIAVYSDVAIQADKRVALVRIIEGVLYGVNVVVLFSEAFFVVRPAIKHLNDALKLIDGVLRQQEQKGDKKEKTP